MSTVYQHQLHAHKHRHRYAKRWLLVGLAVAAIGIFVGLNLLKPDTQITNAKTVTGTIESQAKKTQTFQKGHFSMDLPKGWQFMAKQQDVYTIYHFRSTLPGEDGNRLLDVYEDSNLPNFALNRMVPVVANEDGGLTADAGEVSDNCAAYTTGTTAGRVTVGQMAKWQGIDFLCDMANSLRNVVGTGSKDGLNTVTLSNINSGARHKYFITYTDNNAKPDYNLFIAVLNSFKLSDN